MTGPRVPGFVEPRSLVFWTFLGLAGLGIYWRTVSMFDLWGDSSGGIYTSVVVWLAYGAVVAWAIYRLQLFEHRPVSATVAAVAWGLFVAGGVVALVGQDLESLFDKILGFDASREWGPAFRAPLLEEAMKYLGVVALALIPRVRLTRVLDGVYYGMLSGLGFLVSENIFFSNQEIATGSGAGVGGEIFGVFLVRGAVSLPISHVVYTAIAGAGVGYVMSRRGRPLLGRLAVAAGLYATAFLLHGFQNSPLLDDVSANLFIKGAPALVVFLVVLAWGRREYRRDLRGISQSLSALSDDDFAVLSTRRRRRRAVKAAPDPDRARQVQQLQIGLLVAADIYGAGSEEADAAQTALHVAQTS